MGARRPARPLLAGAGVSRLDSSWGGGWGSVRDLTTEGGAQGWELVPGTGVVGEVLGNELETVGDVEGSPSLVAVGADVHDVAGPTTVGAQAPVVTTLALLWGEGATNSACPVDVHAVGVVAGEGQTWLGGWSGRLGVEREAWSRWLVATPSGGARVRLVQLHEDRRSDVRLKRKRGGATADQFCTHQGI